MKKYNLGICFGAFDPLHFGHIKLIARAKEKCRFLIVGVSDSSYIMKNKGHHERIPLPERTWALRQLSAVDDVVVQSRTAGKKEWVETYKPDVIFVGDDWTPETFSGEGLGVKVEYLPYTKEVSSTELMR